jgi:hypothetical protein
VARSVAFYTHHLGFTLEHQQLPVIASICLGDARILLRGFATNIICSSGDWRLEIHQSYFPAPSWLAALADFRI